MRVLIFGGAGMLGHKIVQVLTPRFDVSCTLHGEFNTVERFELFSRSKVIENVEVTDLDSARSAIERAMPDVVINAVGIIKQIQESGNVVSALSINSIFPHRLKQLAEKLGFRLICVSTDCVFSGSRGMYAEDDIPDSTDLYGQSKHWGEIDGSNCLTLRTSIIGRELASAHGLLEWLLSHRGGSVDGYSKAIFSGFPTLAFADILGNIIEKHPDLSGVFHVSSDPISKFDLLKKIDQRFGLEVQIERNVDFVLDRSMDSSRFRKAVGFVPATWDDMIDKMAWDAAPYEQWRAQANSWKAGP